MTSLDSAQIPVDPDDEPQGPQDDTEYEPLDLTQIEEAELLDDSHSASD